MGGVTRGGWVAAQEQVGSGWNKKGWAGGVGGPIRRIIPVRDDGGRKCFPLPVIVVFSSSLLRIFVSLSSSLSTFPSF